MYALYVQQAYKRPKLKWNVELKKKTLYVQAQYHIYSNALIYRLSHMYLPQSALLSI